MKFYKNVDISDLNSIMEKGILPASVCGNYNWKNGGRATNSHDVVYLFAPISDLNYFKQYGAALLEIELENGFTKSEIGEHDANKEKYDEYIVDRVAPESITRIYIPKIFESRVIDGFDIWNEFNNTGENMRYLSKKVFDKLTFCDMTAEHYVGDECVPFTSYDEMLQSVNHIHNGWTGEYFETGINTFVGGYFRGLKPDGKTVDYFYNIHLIIE